MIDSYPKSLLLPPHNFSVFKLCSDNNNKKLESLLKFEKNTFLWSVNYHQEFCLVY